MDIWLSPDDENRDLFINALLCMQHTETEVASLRKEDFTMPFVATIGNTGSLVDILTYVHQDISFDEAEKQKTQFEIQPGLFLNIVPYAVLKEMKLRSHPEKEMFDIARLEEIRHGQMP